MPQSVYLDQWIWIKLAQAHYGKSKEWKEAHDAVMATAKAERAIFPLSIAHLTETARKQDDGPRARLVDFMVEVWNGNAIRPWSQMLAPEAENAVRVMLGQHLSDLTGFVFGRGIGHAISGSTPVLVPLVPDPQPLTSEQVRRLTEAVLGPESLASLKDPQHAAAIRATNRADTNFATQLQAAIDREYSHPDKKKRNDIAEARFIMTVLLEPLIRAMVKLGADPRAILQQKFTSREAIVRIRESMPTFHTFFILNHVRNTTRKVKENDRWDLGGLNIAIPYCDVVVTEKGWCNIAERSGLAKLYKTNLVHSPQDLVDALAA